MGAGGDVYRFQSPYESKFSYREMDCLLALLLEFVGKPCGNVINFFAGSGFFYKAAGKKMTIDRDKRQVPVYIPEQLCLGHAADVARIACFSGSNESNGIIVQPVMGTLPPEKSQSKISVMWFVI